MNIGEALEKATGLMLERKFHEDPVGYVTAMGHDDTRFARTMGFMIDRQSTVLAEAITSYFQTDPSMSVIHKICGAGGLTGIWRKSDKENFLKDHDGVLNARFEEDYARYPDDSDEAHGVRVFFREYLKIMPEARALLSQNFVAYSALHPSAQARGITIDDASPMLPILAYLGYSPEKVSQRIEQVIDLQIGARASQPYPRDYISVDVNMLSWVQGTKYFDLAVFERGTASQIKAELRQLPLLRMLINSLKANDDPHLVNKSLKNLGFKDFKTQEGDRLGAVLASFAAEHVDATYGRLRVFTQMLKTGFMELEDLRPLLLVEFTVDSVLKYSGFDADDLTGLLAKEERLHLDRALASAWVARAKPEDPEQPISPEDYAELHKLITESFMPFDTAAKGCMILGHTGDIVEGILADESVRALLSAQSLIEPLRVDKSPYRRLIKNLCVTNDADYSETMFERMLEAHRKSDISGAITLNELTTKISADTLDRYVHELPYTKDKFGGAGSQERGMISNNFMLHIFGIVAKMPAMKYSTFDRLYEAAEVYWPEFTSPANEYQTKAAEVIKSLQEAPDRRAECSVADRIRIMEALSYLQKLNAFEFAESPFINQAWEQLIDTFDLKPSVLAKHMMHEEGALSVRKIMVERGLGKEFMLAAKSADRDAMLAADLGL